MKLTDILDYSYIYIYIVHDPFEIVKLGPQLLAFFQTWPGWGCLKTAGTVVTTLGQCVVWSGDSDGSSRLVCRLGGEGQAWSADTRTVSSILRWPGGGVH